MGSLRQGSWSGLPFSWPGDLANPGFEPGSLALQAILYWLSHGKPPKGVERCAYVRDYYYLVRGTQESRSISVVCGQSTTTSVQLDPSFWTSSFLSIPATAWLPIALWPKPLFQGTEPLMTPCRGWTVGTGDRGSETSPAAPFRKETQGIPASLPAFPVVGAAPAYQQRPAGCRGGKGPWSQHRAVEPAAGSPLWASSPLYQMTPSRRARSHPSQLSSGGGHPCSLCFLFSGKAEFYYSCFLMSLKTVFDCMFGIEDLEYMNN